jgi:hypothetical protein
MSDIPANSALRKLISNPDFFKSAGDLISLAEALSTATEDQVNGISRKLIEAAQARLAQLSSLKKVGTSLKDLAHVDTTTLALGADRATSDALVADLDAAGVSLTTGESYYLQSYTTDQNGSIVSTQPNHIATAAEKTTAEAGTLTMTMFGIETRVVALTGGGSVSYMLAKNNTVLTASVADVNTALSEAAALVAPLMATVATDILTIKAFLDQQQQLKGNHHQFSDARRAEGKSIDKNLAEFVALAKVANQRAQERRDEGNAPSRTTN